METFMSFVNQWRDANFLDHYISLWWYLERYGARLGAYRLPAHPETTNRASDTAPSQSNVPEVIIAQTPASIPPATVGLKRMDFPVYLAGVPSLMHPIIPSVPINRKAESDAVMLENHPSVTFKKLLPMNFKAVFTILCLKS